MAIAMLTMPQAFAQDGVGIGNNNPQEMLDVTGAIKLGTTTSTNAGTIRWNGTNFQGYDGSQWVNLDGSGGTAPSLNTSNDGSVLLGSGTAGTLSTAPVTLSQGVYYVTPYNCLSGVSANYYILFNASSLSGSISSGYTVYDWGQNKLYTLESFIVKVQSATAQVRFNVVHANGGTVTNAAGCTNFTYVRIGN